MRKQNKAGFTLIELMVVAIIVAILAAVSIPLMSANKKKAQATEAQAGCGAVKVALRVMQAEVAVNPSSLSTVKGFTLSDLNGTYFINTDYALSSFTSYSNYVLTVTGSRAPLSSADTVVMSNVNNTVSWGGSMLQ